MAHEFVLRSAYNENACHICKNSLFGLPEFVRLLGEEVERRVSEVRHFLAHFLDNLT